MDFTSDELKSSAQTAIFAAAEAGDPDTARGLLEMLPGLVSARDERGNMPLHLAARESGRGERGHVEMARLLLGHGADVHAPGHDDDIGMAAPLLMAAWAGPGGKEMVCLLLQHGADPNGVSTHGLSALAAAAEHGQDDVCRALLEAGARPDIHIAASLGWSDRVRQMLREAPSLLNAPDGYRGATALYFAARCGHDSTVIALLDAGADVNAASASGDTALHVTAASGHVVTAALLIHRGADVNARGASGKTPLHWAMEEWHVDASDMVRLLLRHGADPSARDDARRTARDIAKRFGKTHLMEILDSRCSV